MWLHGVCQIRRQIAKLFRPDFRACAFCNDFDASSLRRARCGHLPTDKVLRARSRTTLDAQNFFQRRDRPASTAATIHRTGQSDIAKPREDFRMRRLIVELAVRVSKMPNPRWHGFHFFGFQRIETPFGQRTSEFTDVFFDIAFQLMCIARGNFRVDKVLNGLDQDFTHFLESHGDPADNDSLRNCTNQRPCGNSTFVAAKSNRFEVTSRGVGISFCRPQTASSAETDCLIRSPTRFPCD